MKNKQNYIIQITETPRISLLISKMLPKYMQYIYNYVSFSCKSCFLSFHPKVKLAEDLILSGIEDHTFGRTTVREHLPEEELTLGIFVSKHPPFQTGIAYFGCLHFFRMCALHVLILINYVRRFVSQLLFAQCRVL